MSEQLNLRMLLVLLSALLLVKIVIMPVIVWQSEELSNSSLEKTRLLKMQRLVRGHDQLRSLVDEYNSELTVMKESLFADSASLKLNSQEEILEIISASNLSVRSFNWVLDSPGPYRTLRAKISYSGSFSDAIQLQWNLAFSPRLFRIVDSRHIIKPLGTDLFGVVEVFLTIELYAMGASVGDEFG